jgi:hypothetical protein
MPTLTFSPRTQFEDVLELYVFDWELQLLTIAVCRDIPAAASALCKGVGDLPDAP